MIKELINNNFIFLFVILFAIFSYIRFTIAQKNLFLLYLFFLPATILHELAHLLVGIVTFAMPTKFSLIPKKDVDGYKLGSVDLKNINFFNAFPIGIAPLLLLVILYFLDKNNFQLYYESVSYLYEKFNILNDYKDIFDLVFFCLLVYLNYILVYSSIPSIQDFKVVFSYKLGIILWILIFSIIAYFVFLKK